MSRTWTAATRTATALLVLREARDGLTVRELREAVSDRLGEPVSRTDAHRIVSTLDYVAIRSGLQFRRTREHTGRRGRPSMRLQILN